MKSGLIVALVLVLTAGLILGLRACHHQETVSAEYKPFPAFTTADKFFAQKTHDLIKTALVQDQEAEASTKSRPVGNFAREGADDEADILNQLEMTVTAINPDFILQPVETVGPKSPSTDRNSDRDYLQEMIRIQERALALIDDTSSGIQKSPRLLKFTALWRADVKGRLRAARALLAALRESSCP